MPVETTRVELARHTNEDVLADTTALPANATFEERWAAWQARGAAHDRAARRKVMIAGPILAVAAAILYALLLR
jgi:hypothetical protein